MTASIARLSDEPAPCELTDEERMKAVLVEREQLRAESRVFARAEADFFAWRKQQKESIAAQSEAIVEKRRSINERLTACNLQVRDLQFSLRLPRKEVERWRARLVKTSA